MLKKNIIQLMLIYNLASNHQKLLVFIRRYIDLHSHYVYSYSNIKKNDTKTWNLSQGIWWKVAMKADHCLSWWKLVVFDDLTLNNEITIIIFFFNTIHISRSIKITDNLMIQKLQSLQNCGIRDSTAGVGIPFLPPFLLYSSSSSSSSP